ncbi:ribosomal protein S18 acetylase RimI-like enzyme [Chryseobacterium bernardetii]|uniref:Acetyltransferase (GNAT) family protein n=2 Tax=Chryseobacterium TaxID=59732 RepID=A0A543EA30_9FLAO|nr:MULTISPECIES: GNAT family N-acetyltransferase [Chryseobacterium]MDR6371966.1 ribosomal protein S18 acetylase RimI-like enzyme [Chryseobacterium vietnamense]MDR6443748.1 ribosomal protein S18 acetylase RimI-like enzyme [Chryseobacterium bernardetii]TQM18453.1 acetyltransferase (GNAT) family protein [Chryseobacterium aquifrigidense]
MENFTFSLLNPDTEIPYHLLLLADETKEAINQYIFKSDIYLLYDCTENIAVMALYKNNNTELEIKNIAVIESYRSKGIGSILMNKAKEIAKEYHYKTLTVGTSDTGFQQIRFYEKNGFIKSGILKDFFIENYPDPIYENGLQMRDMVILTHHLTE